jgi:predicted nucleotide-binding protein
MTTPTDGEWMSAYEALSFLHPHAGGARAIYSRAHAGLIKARAKLFISQGMEQTDVEVPREFWWVGLRANWGSSDFEKVVRRKVGSVRTERRQQAFGVTIQRQDIEQLKPASTAASPAPPPAPAQRPAGRTVFIGHGHSLEWLELEKFLRDRLRLTVVEFNSVSAAGVQTGDRLKEMLGQADFAFLIMSGEDEQATGKFNPRLNVIHEAGLFQGKLGFKKAIILREEGSEDFSNVNGLGDIRFPKGDIGAKFEEVRRVLEREGINGEGVETGSD